MRLQTPIRHIRSIALFASCALLLAGCGGDGGMAKYEEFENVHFREELVEVPLGHYAVPVPVLRTDEAGEVVRENSIQMKFTLHGLVAPYHVAEAERIRNRHEGELRDRVIRVCRNSSLEDLVEPQLSTLKSRILDVAQPLFEGVMLKRVVVTDVSSEPL